MLKPIKKWFFELIEDAIGSKAMKKFREEEKNKNNRSKSTNKQKEDTI